MKIGFIINFEKNPALDIAMKAIEVLKNKAELFCDSSAFEKLSCDDVAACDNLFEQCDICIIIGGDGTIIHNAKLAAFEGKPVLGINAGRIGFLSGLEANELHKLNNLICGELNVEERIMLDIVHQSNDSVSKFTAFNDAVITKGNISRMIDIECVIDEHSLKYRSDGLIFATPTGSTAYSMSAGGPIVDPILENTVVTPICPYAYFTRPIVLPACKELFVRTESDDQKEAYLTVDGEVAVKLSSKDKLNISLSKTKVKLINLRKDSIYNCLEKLTGGCCK